MTLSPRIVRADAQVPRPWRNGGGRTRELLTWTDPHAGDGGGAWHLRISVADIDCDGPFSGFARTQRWFAVIDGAGVRLTLPGGDARAMTPHDAPLHFDGAAAPACRLIDGPTRDLNLMADSAAQCLMQPAQAGQSFVPAHTQCGLFTAAAGRWQCGPDQGELQACELLWFDTAPGLPLRFDAPERAIGCIGWWLGFTPAHKDLTP